MKGIYIKDFVEAITHSYPGMHPRDADWLSMEQLRFYLSKVLYVKTFNKKFVITNRSF